VGQKLVEYAEAGICEYWIVNLVNQQVEVFRQPSIEGIYGDSVAYRPGHSIEPLNAPGKFVAVSDLLPLIK
jgi:Uma2 family endonuclease